MFKFNVKHYENVPVLGALLLVLTNQSVIYAIAGSIAIYAIPNNGDYALLLKGFIGLAMLILIGSRQWADMGVFLAQNRAPIQKGLEKLLTQKHTFVIQGKKFTIDIPDGTEPAVADSICDALQKLFEAPTTDVDTNNILINGENGEVILTKAIDDDWLRLTEDTKAKG